MNWMIGFGDAWVAVAFWANLLIVAVCIVYGLWNWNKTDEKSQERAK